MHLNKRVLKVDALTLPDHHYLSEQDICFYTSEYTAGEGHVYSDTNQLIYNFKKTVDKRGTSEWKYKEQAILQAANIFRAAIKPGAQITFVPIPPSKVQTDPLYDDRLLRMLQIAFEGRHTDVRELVVQLQSMEAVHLSERRPTPDELIANYRLDESLADPAPQIIFIVDDMLTTGCHFKAVQQLLVERFPQAKIAGLFLARRVAKSVDFDMNLLK